MSNLSDEEVIYVLHLRPGRIRARAAGVAEALGLLVGLGATDPAGGPLSEVAGVFWISAPLEQAPAVEARLPRLGYTQAVDRIDPIADASPPTATGAIPPESSAASRDVAPRGTSVTTTDLHDGPPTGARSGALRRLAGERARPTIRWRRRDWTATRVYAEDPAAARERDPDRRTFLLECDDGIVRPITGYRGDGSSTGRRALSSCDARLLVNLTALPAGDRLLDPFAGAGGIVHAANDAGVAAFSADIDPRLRHGLHALGSRPLVADASRLPFADATFDGVASEPPYDLASDAAVVAALGEMARVVRPGGRIALLCAARQAEQLTRAAADLGLADLLATPIDRKGTAVAALAWRKAGGEGDRALQDRAVGDSSG